MEPAELEAAATVAVVTELQAQLEAAAQSVCPASDDVWRLPKERVRPTATPATGPDLVCHAPATVWRRAHAARVTATADSAAAPPPMRIATTSEYGVLREREYASADELGRAVLGELDECAWGAVAATARVRNDGALLITTQLHLRCQRAAGRLQCSACGDFCAGRRGLRDHQQVKHGRTYEEAKDAESAARGALIAYAPAHTVAGRLSEMWAARAARDAAERRALPPALVAARDGDVDTLRRLLVEAAGADCPRAQGEVALSLTDRHGSHALHWAAGSGHVDVCALLVDDLGVGVSDVGSQRDGRTALHWAARNGHVDVCRWLVSRGAPPDARTRDGTTPLHWAVWRGELDAASYLLDEAAADLHALNDYGCNAARATDPLCARPELSRSLPSTTLANGTPPIPSHHRRRQVQWAAQSDVSEGLHVCRWLARRGLDLTLRNRNGHSAVHKAAVKGNAAACAWLLGEGGLGRDHLRPDGDGNTPSRMARAEGFAELAEWLAAREASFNLRA